MSPQRNTDAGERDLCRGREVLVRKRILVVDDDADVVEMLCFNLKKAGFAIGTAFNGVEALKKARSIMPDLILLDLMLPELDGFAVCEILRRDKATASIQIIMLTAMASELGRLTGLDCGANDYVSKPFSPKDLVSRVQNLLQQTAPFPAAPGS
jgi:two-component system, OmpR family, alkaline phosphatase synthesis response regulator PhoP